MTQLSTIQAKGGAALAAVGVASLLAACGSSGHGGHAGSASATPASDHSIEISLSSGHLTGPGDRAIYLWEHDRRDRSTCGGACAAAWPPVLAKSRPTAGHGVKAVDLSTIPRGGKRQATYDGHPLYYYAGDNKGTTRGQGSDAFGAKWWLVNASGAAVTHTSGKSTSSGYSSNGY